MPDLKPHLRALTWNIHACVGSDGRSSFIEPFSRTIGYLCLAAGLDLQLWDGNTT